MTPGQRLAEYDMDSTEDDRKAWEWIAAILALTVAVASTLLIPLGPLLY